MVHKYIITGVVGLSPCTPLKCIPFLAAVPAIMSAAQAVYNGISTARNNKRNIENQNMLWQAQQRQQNFLNANGALIKRQSLERAGLNPMSDFGYSPNVTASVPSPAQQTAPQIDLSPLMALVQQKPVVDANARKTNADAEKQEIENSIKKGEIKGAGSAENIGLLDWNMKNSEFQHNLSQWNADDAEAQLRKMVADERIKPENKRVMQAMIDMPYRDYRYMFYQCKQILADINVKKANEKYLNAQEMMIQFEKKLKESNSLMPLIDKYLGEGAMADFAKAMVIMIGAFTGNVNLGKVSLGVK